MYTERYWKDREFDAIDALAALAKARGIELTTLAVAWVLANPAITAPIVGASKPEQLKAAVAACELKLDASLKAELDKLTHEFRMGDAARGNASAGETRLCRSTRRGRPWRRGRRDTDPCST
jgi:diketogulonate reductase-like aldo/keto reductase